MIYTRFFLISIITCLNLEFLKSSEPLKLPRQSLEEVLQKLRLDNKIDFTGKMRYSLIYYYNNPLDLNNASYDELTNLSILSKEQKEEIINYREENGDFISVYELQLLNHFDINTIETISPFICIKQSWCKNIKERPTYQELSYFITSPLISQEDRPTQVVIRYKKECKNFYRLQLLASKEKKEPFFVGKNNTAIDCIPFAYWSGFFMVENKGIVKRAILGDYALSLGEGLINGYVFAVDESSEVIKILRAPHQGIIPLTASSRKSGLRGGAITLKVGKWELISYLSNQYLDPTVRRDKNGIQWVESISKRGIALTNLLSYEKQSSLQEKSIGSSLIYKNNNTLLGVQSLHIYYDKELRFNQGVNHNHFFNGKDTSCISIFGRTIWENIHGFVELSRSKGGGVGALGGLMSCIGKKTQMSTLFYNYSPNFHTIFGNGFGKTGTYNRNKTGSYVGLTYQPINPLCFSLFLHLRKHLQPHKRLHQAPLYEFSTLLSSTYSPERNKKIVGKVKVTSKPSNAKGSKVFAPLCFHQNRLRLSVHSSYPINKYIDGLTKVQCTIAKTSNKSRHNIGFGVKQLLSYSFDNFKIKGWSTLYYSEGFKSALYFHSPNIRSSFNFPPLYGRGGLEGGVIISRRVTKQSTLKLQVHFNCFLGGSIKSTHKKNSITVSLKWIYH